MGKTYRSQSMFEILGKRGDWESGQAFKYKLNRYMYIRSHSEIYENESIEKMESLKHCYFMWAWEPEYFLVQYLWRDHRLYINDGRRIEKPGIKTITHGYASFSKLICVCIYVCVNVLLGEWLANSSEHLFCLHSCLKNRKRTANSYYLRNLVDGGHTFRHYFI